jgi:hypothetical protein
MLYPLNMKKFVGKKRGYISLMSVIILGSLGAAVSTSVMLLGLGSSRSGYAYDQSNRALLLADACIEEGLQKVREDDEYVGSGEITFSLGECSYTVENITGSQKRVFASGVVGENTRRASVETSSLRPQITIDSWREVAD